MYTLHKPNGTAEQFFLLAAAEIFQQCSGGWIEQPLFTVIDGQGGEVK